MFKVEHVSETLNCYQLSSTAARRCFLGLIMICMRQGYYWLQV